MTHQSPWVKFAEEHSHKEKVSSKISCIVDFGIFVDLQNGINGIVHLNDIDWVIPGEKAIVNYNVGDLIEVIILAIDPERERISLGIKQLFPDPREGQGGEPPAPVAPKDPSPKPPKPLSEAAQY